MRTQVLYAREPRWRDIAERAEELIRSAAFRPVKAERRKVAGVVTLVDGTSVFIKKSESGSWLRGIVMPISGSPVTRALKGASLLEAAEIPHPRPLAASHAIARGGAVRASYLVSDALLDGDTLSKFALGPGGIAGRDAHRRRRILDSVARQVRRLHDAGLYTRDLQETNVMVADGDAGEFRVWFLDLEDFRRTKRGAARNRMRNLVHLDRSIGRFLCRAARLAFLYAYLGARPGRAEARRAVAEVLSLRAKMERRRSRTPAVAADIAQSHASAARMNSMHG